MSLWRPIANSPRPKIRGQIHIINPWSNNIGFSNLFDLCLTTILALELEVERKTFEKVEVTICKLVGQFPQSDQRLIARLFFSLTGIVSWLLVTMCVYGKKATRFLSCNYINMSFQTGLAVLVYFPIGTVFLLQCSTNSLKNFRVKILSSSLNICTNIAYFPMHGLIIWTFFTFVLGPSQWSWPLTFKVMVSFNWSYLN